MFEQRERVQLTDAVAVAAVSLLALSLLRTLGTPLTDPDLWWHLRLGHALPGSWRFSGPDPLGGFAPGYTYNQWVPELAYAAAESAWGLPGVALLAHAARLAVVVSLYAAARTATGPLVCALVTATGFLGLSGALSPRPQVWGLPLLALVAVVALRSGIDGRPRWWLVPLTWVWACVHGTWLVGVAALVAAVVGRALDQRAAGAVDGPGLVRLAAVPVAAGLAALLTPVGLGLLTVTREVQAVSGLISEWQPAGLTDPPLLALLVLAGVPVLVWARAGGTSWVPLLLTGLAVALALSSTRGIALGSVLLVPICAAAAGRLPLGARSPGPALRRLERVGLTVAVVGSLLLGPVVSRGATADLVPAEVDRALSGLPGGTVLLTADTLGGWVWWAHPGLRPTLDTRAEAYGAAYLTRQAAALAGKPDWERTVAQTGATAALLPSGSPLVVDLVRSHGWTILVRSDRVSLLTGAALPPP